MDPIQKKPPFRKVLFIDDNETERFIARRMIEKYQFCEELVVHESAPDALEYLRSLENTPGELPQLIFLDIRMPEMDGFEFIEEYATLPESVRSNCIIMMLSSSLSPEDRQRAESSVYVSRFINKPLSMEVMERIEQELFQKNA